MSVERGAVRIHCKRSKSSVVSHPFFILFETIEPECPKYKNSLTVFLKCTILTKEFERVTFPVIYVLGNM